MNSRNMIVLVRGLVKEGMMLEKDQMELILSHQPGIWACKVGTIVLYLHGSTLGIPGNQTEKDNLRLKLTWTRPLKDQFWAALKTIWVVTKV